MELTKYFFDSYAVIELLSGNPNYAKYVNEPTTITIFNLAEIYWSALKNLKESDAEIVYARYSECVTEIPDEVLKKAMKFKKVNKKKRLSYADCIGYIYSIENGLIFVTGDQAFKYKEGVKFIK